MIRVRYRENENESLISSPNMKKEVEPIINDNASSLPPQLQYDSEEDPEYDKKEITEAFWGGYNSKSRLSEAGPSILSYIKDYIRKNGNANLNDIAASLPDDGGSMTWYKKHLDELQKRINKVLVGSGTDIGNAATEIEPPHQFSANDLTNDLAKELVSDNSAVDEVMSAADSANDKFDTIYSIARTILTGRGIKHHGFIYGAPGVGKCASYEEKIPVKIDGVESVAEVGTLYDKAVAAGAEPFKEGDGEFAEVPFDLQIKDENGEWIPSTMVYRKEDAIYEVEFEKDGKIKTGKYAAEHILPYDFKAQLSTYVKDLQAGDKLPSGHTVKSVEKVADKDFVYSPQADSESHCYQDTDGLIHHNTYSVKQAIKYEFPKGALAKKGYQIEFNSGDIGRSASAIVAFFYKNRENKVIVLDDCDAFLLATDQAIQNLLKAMLDLDNTEKNPKYISVSPTIRNLASKLINADSHKMDEGIDISVDESRLREGMLTISVNGKVAYDEAATEEDLKTFRISEAKKSKGKKLDEASYFGLDLYNEELNIDENDLDDGSIEDANELKQLETGEEDEGIPPKWRFTSRLIMISNLKKDQLNDAVLSRTLSYGLFLTRDEFMARLAQILPNLLTDVETEASPHMVDYAKKVAYAYLLAAVDISNNGGSVSGRAVKITAPLQFRVIAELAGKWMQRVDNYMMKNGIDDESEETLNNINNQIKHKFFVFDVIPSLQI